MNTTGKGGRLPEAHRLAAKEIFLQHYASCHNAKKACRAAGINKNTFQIWLRNGTLTNEDLAYALGNYQDEIRYRFNVIDGYDPFGTPGKRQLRILAYRHLPELRRTSLKFGEVLIDTSWWSMEECALLQAVIDQNNAAMKQRQQQYKQRGKQQ